MNGVIARVVKDKGFGFVKGEDNVERFFHLSGVVGDVSFDELKEGDRVTFEAGQSPKGPRAERISIRG